MIATDSSTKLIPYLEGIPKTYEFCVSLDGASETFDAEGVITPVDTRHISIPPDHVIIDFLEYMESQIPPKYSALHINGVRAYTLAQRGKEFDLPSRPIRIENVRIIDRKQYALTLSLTISS